MATWKPAIKKAALSCRILSAWSRLTSPKVAILRYHSVAENPGDYATTIGTSIIHPAEVFRRQMELLARQYRVITLDEVLGCLEQQTPIPRRAVAITFDDGFRDNYEVAAPILERCGLRATFYVTTGPAGNGTEPWFCTLRRAFCTTQAVEWCNNSTGLRYELRDESQRTEAFRNACAYCATLAGRVQQTFVDSVLSDLRDGKLADQRLMMTWEEIRDLHGRGHVIGSHSVTHPNLAYLPEDEVQREIAESKETLERAVGYPVAHFSYPHPILDPHYTEGTVALTKKAGYATAVTCTPGAVRVGHEPLRLRRVVVPHDIDEFRWVLEASLAGRVL